MAASCQKLCHSRTFVCRMWCSEFCCFFLWIFLNDPAPYPDSDPSKLADSWLSFPDIDLSLFADPLRCLNPDSVLCKRLGLLFYWNMASARRCCVPNCSVTREDKIILHSFPNPDKEPGRFRDWIYAIKGDILALDNKTIFKKRKVCHNHFASKYHTWTRTLSPNAVPTLNLPEIFPSPKVLRGNEGSHQIGMKASTSKICPSSAASSDITNESSNQPVREPEPMEASTSKIVPSALRDITNESSLREPEPMDTSKICPSSAASSDITNESSNQPVREPEPMEASTSKMVPSALRDITNESSLREPEPMDTSSISVQKAASHTLKKRAAKNTKAANKDDNISYLRRLVKKLTKKKDNYSKRLKNALKLSENITFQKCLNKFTTLAALFTIMQFRESGKDKHARRFTREEKIMALSLYKQGPRAYRWLSKVFVLPSPLTLSRMITRAGIKPGVNTKILSQLRKRAETMAEHEKLCLLLFDEIAISPNFHYSSKKDKISGFATNGTKTKRTIADHALVFMLRGVITNYKQPIAYTFCTSTTPAEELKDLIKKIIVGVHGCGLKILATVCDQGSTNVSAINKLIEETRQDYLSNNKEFRNEIFEVEGEEVVPLFDTPHLMKGVRNNLLNKHLKCTINNAEKIAKWNHIIQLYEENPAYKGIRLVKNLTEVHVNPKKICKMKVKYATQVFSRTVAVNMGYLAGKGILQKECEETADVLLFFDELFDSMNGSYENSKKRNGKELLGAVTPTSRHWEVWIKAKKVLKSIKFVSSSGIETNVPSIRNWIRTIDNIQYLTKKIFEKHNFKSIWMRHFNQDPLENFFGAIRCHGMRNVSPSPSGFEAAFASLLVTNIANHSPGSNCEQDFCKSFISLKNLFDNADTDELMENIEIDFEDLQCNVIDYKIKERDPKINAELSYVSGYVLRKAKNKIFSNCLACKQVLIGKSKDNEYLNKRNYRPGCLTYPSENVKIFFSQMQDIIYSILEKKSDKKQLLNYCKTVILINADVNFLQCKTHREDVLKFVIDLTCRFFVFNWCRDVNKILNGTRTDVNPNDVIKNMAYDHHKKKQKIK